MLRLLPVRRGCCYFAPFVFWTAAAAAGESADDSAPRSATLVVAAHDAAPRSKGSADVVCDGEADQEEINAAIRALPDAGGTLLLSEGTFDIRKVEGTLGGVLIDRNDVVLAGQGTSTKLLLAADQNTNGAK